MTHEALQAPLLSWYHKHARDLPWRRSTDTYAILVSEVMLQQTRASVAAPYFEKWMRTFPTAADLAGASDDEVIAAWAGLGFYQRARRLHETAKLLAKHGAPTTLQAWLEQPGVGHYTAAAVASIAQGLPAAAVDGNVERVVARLFDVADPARTAAGKRTIQAHADTLLARDDPGTWNQAMMELGATVCTPLPACDACPWTDDCLARKRGTTMSRPNVPKRLPPTAVDMQFAFMERDGHVLLVKRPPGQLLAGTWSLPGGPSNSFLADVLHQTGRAVQPLGPVATASHTFSHRIWSMTIMHAEAKPASAAKWPTKWVPVEDMDSSGISTATRKAIDAMRAARVGPP